MDNGQYTNSLKDPFAEGITVGVGTIPASANQPSGDDLNTRNFQVQDSGNLNERGNSTLNAIDAQSNGFELTMPPTGQPNPPLGQIVDLTISPQITPSTGPKETAIQNKTAMQSDEKDISMDPTIADHLADGKVDKSDVGYLENKTEDLVNNPEKLGEFVMKARRTINNRLSGDSK